MIQRVFRGLVAGLMLALIVILGVSYSSAHAQTQTRHLVFSTYLGPKTTPNRPCAYLRPELRQRRPGEYLRDRRHRRLQSSRLSECLPTGPRSQQHPVGVRGEIRPQRPTALVHLPGRRQSEHGHRGGRHAEWRRGGRRPHHFGYLGTFPTMNAYQGTSTTEIRITS